MTPFGRFFARRLPAVLRIPVLALAYLGMAVSIVLATRHDISRIIYVDIRAANNAD